MVIAAEQYAARLVLPVSQRSYRTPWSSHKDIATKALAKLVGPHLPVSLKALERAVTRAHAEHNAAIKARSVAITAAAAAERAEADGEPDEEVDGEPGDETERAGIEP